MKFWQSQIAAFKEDKMRNLSFIPINILNFTASCFVLIILLPFQVASGAEFSWLPNTEADIAGYKIHYGQTEGGPYPNVVDIGKPDPVDNRIYGQVQGLECGVVYYVVCTAYNTDGVESDYSTQITYTVANEKPQTPSSLEIIP
jgi:hypothetical protein